MLQSHNVCGRDGTAAASAGRKVVFLSHRREDKDVARAIGRYFDFLGQYYYLDEQDPGLQRPSGAVAPTDAQIVECIERGLAHSTMLLAVLSSRTMGSWWVPYEIG